MRSEHFTCDICGEDNLISVSTYEDLKPDADISVYGSVRIFEYRNHIEIKMDDWEKFKSVIIPLLKQGDVKHAAGNTEKWSKETNYAGHKQGISANPVY